MNEMTIGQVAKRSNVGVETVRYYERQGLIDRAPRKRTGIAHEGYRQFDEETVRRIVFVKRAQDLGFTLREIKDLLSLRVRKPSQCDSVQRRAQQKLQEVDEKIAWLTRIKGALTQLLETCHERGSENECPILAALGGGNEETRV